MWPVESPREYLMAICAFRPVQLPGARELVPASGHPRFHHLWISSRVQGGIRGVPALGHHVGAITPGILHPAIARLMRRYLCGAPAIVRPLPFDQCAMRNCSHR